MVPFGSIARVVGDAARLVMKGEVLVSGSATLAWWTDAGPDVRFVDLCIAPDDAAQRVTQLMGVLGWYEKQFGHHVVVASPDTFVAPPAWSRRAKRVRLPDAPSVEVVAPHPHDVMLAKLERYDAQDQVQIRHCLGVMPLVGMELDDLVATMPQRAPTFPRPATAVAGEASNASTGSQTFDDVRRKRFDFNVTRLRALLDTL